MLWNIREMKIKNNNKEKKLDELCAILKKEIFK